MPNAEILAILHRNMPELFFETLNFDAITVAPYMGEDSIRPFLEYEHKWTIVLGLTSNPGAANFELLSTGRERVFERVLKMVSSWGTPENTMFVIGATQAEEFVNVRRILPDHFFLVPGVGTQGGSLEEISQKAMNKDCGLLVNVSRAVIYAGAGEDFAEKAAHKALQYQAAMRTYIN